MKAERRGTRAERAVHRKIRDDDDDDDVEGDEEWSREEEAGRRTIRGEEEAKSARGAFTRERRDG